MKIFTGIIIVGVLGALGLFGMRALAGETREPLEVGASVPVVEAELQDGRKVALNEVVAKGYALVYFYPKADTGGCTAQACSLRDAYTVLQEKGVLVFGVSRDKMEAQAAFREKYHLPFDLIADPKGDVVAAFGVPTVPGAGYSKRQAYLFKDGVLVWRDLAASTKQQADDVLKVVEGKGDPKSDVKGDEK